MSLAPGTRIRRYEVQTPLGAGGMGEVYLARDVELDRLVALKILPRGEDAHDEERVHRFLQEARAAISLSHPNVAHIYDAGDHDGLRFMAMEYVQGETLRTRLRRARLSMDEALEIAQQIALALASAHHAGIVHRDVKPENVMLRPDGYVKVLDFGLAKLTLREHGPDAPTAVMQTAPGVVMGTMHYMSPEQLRGESVDARSDVFSLGVVLYEMVGGRRPFEASSSTGVVAAILTEHPPRLEGIPQQVDELLATALAKNREQRYATAREMAEALKKARHDTQRIRSGDVPTQALTQAIPKAVRSRRIRIVAAALLLVLLAAGAWLAKRTLDVRKARATLPEIERLMADARYFEAWDLAQSAQVVLGSDERLVRALQAMSEPLTVESKPPGAEVFLERVLPDGSTGARRLVGATPLVKHPIARGNYILSVEKIGFAPLRRPVSAQPLRVAGTIIPQPPPPFELTLLESSKVPEGMVHVEGGPYRLTGWMPVTDASVKLDSFFIDQYEVSNADFERFIRAGGYRRREWWKHPFEKDGRTLSFEEAMPLLRDATGLPGPRSWAQSRPPHGRENYPVTGITWYEAAAYAEFAGKKLPTIYQWDKAARNGRRAFAGSIFPWGMTEPGGDVTARVNFRGGGPMPVDSLAAGMSMWGVHHLAGNVSEMLRNRNNDGFAATGGAFDDPTYEFSAIGAYPGFFSSPKLGFRCVREVSPRGDQGAFALATTKVEVPPFTPVGDAEYARLLRHYDYDRTNLNVKPLERVDAPDWVREKVSFTGARGKTAFAYLYLPKSARPPYQVIHYLPAADVGHGRRSLPMSIEQAHAAIIRSGRAFFGVVLEGYMERRSDDAAAPPDGWNEAVDHTIDLRRGLDYLASRPDIASDKIGFLSPSADFALIITAIDDRYDAAAYIGSRFRPGDVAPHLERGNFVPRIKPPKLVMHGRYDEVNSLKTEAEPLVALMRGQKTLLPYDGGHIPVGDWAIPQLIQWYDSVLGPVTQ